MILNQENSEPFLTPISESHYAGHYLKVEGGAYRPLRSDFNQAQTSLRALTESSQLNDSLIEANQENWQTLSDHLAHCFQNDSKDIELLGWFIAAQIVLDPTLKAFSASLELMHTLFVEHFDEIHPILPDDKLTAEDDEAKAKERVAFKFHTLLPLLGDSDTSGLLFMPLQLTPLIGDINYFNFVSAQRRRQLDVLQQKASERVGVEHETICERLLTLNKVKDDLHDIEIFIHKHAREMQLNAPNFTFLKNQLHGMLTALEQLSGIKIDSILPKTTMSTENLPSKDSVNSIETLTSEAMSNTQNQRQESGAYTRTLAYQELRHIADFFKRTEPHSPVPYLLEKAIRWGAMPLNELLTELLTGQPDIKDSIFKLTGLNEAGQVQRIVQTQSVDIIETETPPSEPADTRESDNDPATTSTHPPSTSSSPGSGSNQLW